MKYSNYLGGDTYTIFLFHGVIPRIHSGIRNYTKKHLMLDRFEAVLDDLSEKGTPISMQEIVEATTRRHRLAEQAFAITFDDGFENNFSVAVPVLRARKLPATFYVTTNFIDSNGCSWIDTIEYAVDRTDKFQIDLPFVSRDKTYRTSADKIALLTEIRGYVKNNPNIDPYNFALDIWKQLGVAGMQPDPYLDQKMSWQQLQALCSDSIFTVGGHGQTHSILEYLDDADLAQEISTSIEMLERNLNTSVTHYSYPEGLSHCYSDRVISMLRRHGIVCAPTAEAGQNFVGDDLFRLKRIIVAE